MAGKYLFINEGSGQKTSTMNMYEWDQNSKEKKAKEALNSKTEQGQWDI